MQDKLVEKMVDPNVDFLNAESCKKTPRCLEAIYQKIFSELSTFFKNKYDKHKSIILDAVTYKSDSARFKFIVRHGGKETRTRFQVEFDGLELRLYIDDGKRAKERSEIYGANFHKDSGKVTNIKVDLVSFKETICHHLDEVLSSIVSVRDNDNRP